MIAQATKKSAAAKSKKFELTEEQKQEIREAFDLFDTDGSGEKVASKQTFLPSADHRDSLSSQELLMPRN